MGNFTKELRDFYLKQSIENALKTNLKLTAVIIGTKCCAECDKIIEKRIPLEELVKSPFLPYKKCTRKPFCICCYGFDPDRDENGDLFENT